MDYHSVLVPLIEAAIKKDAENPLTFAEIAALLEEPRDPSHGDRSFPCFQLARNLKKAPPLIAQSLAANINSALDASNPVESVIATGPYLNFRFKKSAVAEALIPAILDGSFINPVPATGVRVMVEYSQPNTHKAFHVGHCRNATLGDTLARILKWQGHTVLAVNYFGDEGTHVARCLWYLEKHYKGEIPDNNRGEFLGTLYVKATSMLELAAHTTMPFPGIITARVDKVEGHPNETKWTVVTLTTDESGESKTVVCAGSGFKTGDLVAYALPGVRLSGKAVGSVDKKGIHSEGMICSERELEVSRDNEKIYVLENGKPGEPLIEVFRIEGSIPADCSVISMLEERKREVSFYLQEIESGKGRVYDLWRETRKWSLEEFQEIYEWLNCSFDQNFCESEVGDSGKQLVLEYLAKGIFKEDQGAIGADLSDENLGFCLLIKRDGTALYACRDLALAKKKFEEFEIDRSFYVVDAAQRLHFEQVFSCLRRMGFPQAEDCHHVDYAQVVKPEGKMSSRKGNVILFSELTSLLVTKITAEYLEKYRGEWTDEEIEDTANKIALATVRYGMLSQDNNSQIVFDIEEWTSRSGNTGPYLLYQSARIQSILREASVEIDPASIDYSLLSHEAEYELLKHIQGYHDAIEKVATGFSPHHISNYLYELTKRFSRMYQHCSVLHAGTPALSNARLALLAAAGTIIDHGLSLLGISVVKRM